MIESNRQYKRPLIWRIIFSLQLSDYEYHLKTMYWLFHLLLLL